MPVCKYFSSFTANTCGAHQKHLVEMLPMIAHNNVLAASEIEDLT